MLISPPIIFMAPIVMAADSTINKVEEAERIRMSQLMRNLAKRNQWRGVDINYRKIRDLKGAKSIYRDHFIGAQAAFNLGNIGGCKQRLQRAIDLEAKSEAVDWMKNIDAQFFAVEIVMHRRYKGKAELKIDELPFMPEEQNAVRYAQESIKEKGGFTGLLPIGEYSIVDQRFSLKQGAPPVAINLVPPKGPPLITHIGSRIDIGAAYGSAGQAQGNAINSDPFGGAGPRLGVGMTMDIREKFHLTTQIGYHGMLASGDEPSPIELRSFGYQSTATRYHSVFGWLGLGYRTDKITLLLGPSFDIATAQTQGLDKNSVEDLLSEDSARFSRMTGQIRSGGVSGGVTYDLMTIGTQLNGGLSGMFGIQNDSARWYSWGQFAFTITSRRKS